LKDLENQLGSFSVKVGQTRLQEIETLVEIHTKQERQEGAITTADVKTVANAHKAEIGVAQTDDAPTTMKAWNTMASTFP
jgi:hypothetical protein